MPNTNASFSPMTRSMRLQAQLEKLDGLSPQAESRALAEFDTETEQLLSELFGATSQRLQTYKYATTAEAATMVNMPEPAQEGPSRDFPKKALQQRRQVLLGCLSEIQDAEAKEAEVLAGEDHEDPPGMS